MAAVFDWLGDEVANINLSVVEIVNSSLQTEQLALGGDLNGDNEFIIADTKQGVANNLYWPAGSISGSSYKISGEAVNRTLQYKDWWFAVMEQNDYIFCLMNNEQINSVLDLLYEAAGKTIGYKRIIGSDE